VPWDRWGINGNDMEVQLALALAGGTQGDRASSDLDTGPSPSLGCIRAESGPRAASCRATTIFGGSIVLNHIYQACHLSVARCSFSPLLIKSALSARVDSFTLGAS